MKVRELIETLKYYPEELEVRILDLNSFSNKLYPIEAKSFSEIIRYEENKKIDILTIKIEDEPYKIQGLEVK